MSNLKLIFALTRQDTNDQNQIIRGSWMDWSTHLRGIEQLISLRGGLAELEHNEALRITISW